VDVIRDVVRAGLAVVVMATAAALVVEVRFHLAAIDIAARQGVVAAVVRDSRIADAEPAPGPLRRLGRATLDMADAAIGVVR
jgi:hypothetical protein